VVIQPDCKTSRSAASSASPIDGRENGKNSLIIFLLCIWPDPTQAGRKKYPAPADLNKMKMKFFQCHISIAGYLTLFNLDGVA
jgi:hypothetical protein